MAYFSGNIFSITLLLPNFTFRIGNSRVVENIYIFKKLERTDIKEKSITKKHY